MRELRDECGWSLVVREIEETALPGVGVRYSFVSSKGQRLSVLHHRSGRRELFVEVAGDPDAARLVLDLDERDSRILGELLGESRVVPDFERLQQTVGGMTLDWLTVEPASPAAGRTIGELAVRSSTGATVVSVLRGEEQIPNPAPDVRLEAGDIAVVIGVPESCRRARDVFRGG